MRRGEHGPAWLDTPYASDKVEAQEDVYIYPADDRAMTTVVSCNSPLDPVSRNPPLPAELPRGRP